MAGPERGPSGGVTPTTDRRALSEGAHKIDAPPTDGAGVVAPVNGPKTGVKRNFNEAAHKLGYWPVTGGAREEGHRAVGGDPRRLRRRARRRRSRRQAGPRARRPRHRLRRPRDQPALHGPDDLHAARRRGAYRRCAGIYGISSLIFWALIIEVSIKYAGFIMRAHNRGDGGIMALSALIQRRKVPRAAALVTPRPPRRRAVLRRRHDHAGDLASPRRSRASRSPLRACRTW